MKNTVKFIVGLIFLPLSGTGIIIFLFLTIFSGINAIGGEYVGNSSLYGYGPSQDFPISLLRLFASVSMFILILNFTKNKGEEVVEELHDFK